MIIRMFRKDREDVIGTLNTSGVSAEATGVGEPLLEMWIRANEGTPTPDITRQLETYFAGWNRPERYSQIDEDVELPKEVE